tara:strand:+ start:538 stop:1515 length:978 start_codon:yes stop_codon:yes gene_type:complete
MLPSLGALPLAPTGAQDDVVTEIRAEQRAQAAVAAVRSEVLDNEDLVKEIVAALDQGGSSWEACKLATRLCALNRERRAACDDEFWHELVTRIWGDFPYEQWVESNQPVQFINPFDPSAGRVPPPPPPPLPPPKERFRIMCVLEHAFFTGERTMTNSHSFIDVKRFVLAAIAGRHTATHYQAHELLRVVSSRLKDDEDVVRAAVAKDPRAILWASPRLQAMLGPVLRPTVYWPKEEPTDFERKFGEPLLHLLMLHGSYIPSMEEDNYRRLRMTVSGNVSYLQQQSLYPEFDAPMWYAWTPEDLQKLVDLYNALTNHLSVQIPAFE